MSDNKDPSIPTAAGSVKLTHASRRHHARIPAARHAPPGQIQHSTAARARVPEAFQTSPNGPRIRSIETVELKLT